VPDLRPYDAWYAHITLAMAAAAFLIVTRTTGNATSKHPLTANEIRRLLAALVLTIPAHRRTRTNWSTFRRRCLQLARNAHYRKRLSTLGSYEPP
jgi:hypothetical protein